MAKITRKHDYILCQTDSELRDVVGEFVKKSEDNLGFGIDTETGGLEWFRDPLYLISLYTEGFKPVIVPLSWGVKITLSKLAENLAPLLENESLDAYYWNAKFDLHFLRNVGIRTRNKVVDVQIIGHLVNNLAPHKLKLAAREILRMEMAEFRDLFNLKKGSKLIDYPLRKVALYAADDAVATYRLAKHFMGDASSSDKHLTLGGDAELGLLFRKIEQPLTKVLFGMERRGLRLNREKVARYESELLPALHDVEKKIYVKMGKEFNMNSPAQLLPLLKNRGHHGLKSTSEEALTKVFKETGDPIVELILSYRGLEKLRGTYVEGLRSKCDSKGIIHTNFNQTGTDTGRLSSSGPNIQNIPQDEVIRDFFAPPPGHVFIVRDYGQVELRMAAHVSPDVTMIKEFQRGDDIHRVSAAGIFGKNPEEITDKERQLGKSTTSFGVLFDMSPASLGRKLGVSETKATIFIEKWYHKYRGVDVFFKRLAESAKQTGYVRTLFGRLRYIAGLRNPESRGELQAALRAARSVAIQGGTADLIKYAMTVCDQDQRLKRLGARMLVQVHDELMFHVPARNAYKADLIISDLMVNFPVAKKLRVPLTTDGGIGHTWSEAKKGALNELYAKLYG